MNNRNGASSTAHAAAAATQLAILYVLGCACNLAFEILFLVCQRTLDRIPCLAESFVVFIATSLVLY